MTLSEVVLQKLDNWQPPRDTRSTLVINEPAWPWVVTITADHHEELSTAVWELRVERKEPEPAAPALADCACSMAGRVKSLLDPLQVHEVDLTRGAALLRTAEPRRRGDRVSFFEIRLEGSKSATLRRFRAPVGRGRREQVVFPLTHEALSQLIVEWTGADTPAA